MYLQSYALFAWNDTLLKGPPLPGFMSCLVSPPSKQRAILAFVLQLLLNI